MLPPCYGEMQFGRDDRCPWQSHHPCIHRSIDDFWSGFGKPGRMQGYRKSRWQRRSGSPRHTRANANWESAASTSLSSWSSRGCTASHWSTSPSLVGGNPPRFAAHDHGLHPRWAGSWWGGCGGWTAETPIRFCPAAVSQRRGLSDDTANPGSGRWKRLGLDA